MTGLWVALALVGVIAFAIGYVTAAGLTRWAHGDVYAQGYDRGWQDCLQALAWIHDGGDK